MILDLTRESTCVFDGKTRMRCERCEAGTEASSVPGCDARVQDGRLFFWSESNIGYECPGGAIKAPGQYVGFDDDMPSVDEAFNKFQTLRRKIIL